MSAPTAADRRRSCLWLAALAARNCGAVGRLVRAAGGFAEVADMPVGEIERLHRACRRSRRPPADERAPESFADVCGCADRGVVTWFDTAYPQGLRDLYDPPPALFVSGRDWQAKLARLATQPAVAIVGSRGPSPYGREMAAGLARELTAWGVAVVSGLALGIDAVAHREALAVLRASARANVVPCAVLGCGASVVHPRQHRRLFLAMYDAGLLVSEYGWDLPAAAWRFPARNRVIAALSEAVIVVEGRADSGALHTAAFAAETGRDVLAVPGEAGRPLAAGPHHLLRDGAHLCESAADVLALLPQVPAKAGQAPESQWAPADPCEARVFAGLQNGEQTVDELAQATGLAILEVVAATSRLEVAGRVAAVAGGRYRVVRAADVGSHT